MQHRQLIFLTFLFLTQFPVLVHAQAQAGPMIRPAESASVYDDSTAGLRLQLHDILNAARGQDRSRLEYLVRQTEIPDHEQWFTKTFQEEKGKAWAESYSRYLAENEKELAELLIRLSNSAGEFSISRVRGNQAADGTMASAMFAALQRPTDIFFVEWKKLGTLPTSIGYFFFIDGKFRWNSATRAIEIQSPQDMNRGASQVDASSREAAESSGGSTSTGNDRSPARAGTNGVGYPSCVYCPSPQYTEPARKKGLEGNVSLQVIVRANGTVTDVQVLQSPDPELSEMAVEGVGKWHLNPARGPNGEPIAVIVPIEITFRVRH